MPPATRRFLAASPPSLASVARRLWRAAARQTRPLVVLLIDGLGADTLERFAPAMPQLAAAWQQAGAPVARSCFPSTTVSCLPTLGRAAAPADHGLVGYSFRVRGGGGTRIAYPSHLGGDAAPLALGERAPLDGRVAFVSVDRLRSCFLAREAFPQATLTCMARASRPAEHVARLAARHAIVFLYARAPDFVAHRQGLGSRAHLAALRHTDLLYGELARRLDRFALMVLADHGMVRVDRWLELERYVSRGELAAVAGEARAVHLYARDGRSEALSESCRSIPGATILSRAELVAGGLLDGVPSATVASRVGDVVVTFVHAGAGLTWPGGPGEQRAPAQHGGISDAELLVPCLTLARGA
jgi:predicted AlkP superfamily pyrophosphatase or phosphodiesterase